MSAPRPSPTLPPCCRSAVVAALRGVYQRREALDREDGRPMTLARHTDAGRERIAREVARLAVWADPQ